MSGTCTRCSRDNRRPSVHLEVDKWPYQDIHRSYIHGRWRACKAFRWKWNFRTLQCRRRCLAKAWLAYRDKGPLRRISASRRANKAPCPESRAAESRGGREIPLVSRQQYCLASLQLALNITSDFLWFWARNLDTFTSSHTRPATAVLGLNIFPGDLGCF